MFNPNAFASNILEPTIDTRGSTIELLKFKDPVHSAGVDCYFLVRIVGNLKIRDCWCKDAGEANAIVKQLMIKLRLPVIRRNGVFRDGAVVHE